MTFDFQTLRFSFVAREAIEFPAVVPANILRGGFGLALRRTACECGKGSAHEPDCLYARLFEPEALAGGPSGLKDHPRPFVFRARELSGRAIESGEPFFFDMNVFETRFAVRPLLETAFSQLSDEGLGPTRGRAKMTGVDNQLRSADLTAKDESVSTIQVSFLTPTELKSGQKIVDRPEFPVLFARIRDRISILRSLYGAGPLGIDYMGLGQRAGEIALTNCELQQTTASRRSTRTGQQHGLGGFTGQAEYSGALDEFIPYLRAAQWTGVGRQTVWGKGELSVQTARPEER